MALAMSLFFYLMTAFSSNPFTPDTTRATTAFSRLVEIIAQLRAPDGCPWDREQTHLTLRRHLIEVLDAIESDNDDDLKEELGDLLMQPIMHAQLATEAERFDIAEVLEGICSKLVRRHPHVFGEVMVSDSGEVLRNWDAIKKAEKQGKNQAERPSVLGNIPPALPALLQALEVSKKAAKAGFEWPDADGVLDKAHEEIDELKEALDGGDKTRIGEELGDLLFTIVNVARWQKIDPELALRDMVRRFQTRFEHMEDTAQAQNLKLEELTPEQWDELWNKAKQK
jgi:tetrapyrrole methylase family protein/MazG family protein